MTTITPQQPPPPPAPPPSAPKALPSVIVSSPPEALTKLLAGSQFEGTVATAGSKTGIQLTTIYGTLQIQTTLPLEKGATLNLILQNLVPEVQLQIATINGRLPHVALRGQTPPQVQAQPAATAAAGPSTIMPQATGTGPAGLIGTAATVTLLRPPVPASPGVQPTVPGQGGVTPHAPGTGGPTHPAKPSTLPAAAARPAAGAPGAAAARPGTAQAAPAPLVQGTHIPVRIVAVRVPAAGAPLPAPPALAQAVPAQGQTMTATVTNTATPGQTVLQSPLGPISLATSTPLPRGTSVTLEVTGQPVPPDTAKPPPPPLGPVSIFRAQDWPALREAVQVLQQVDPQAAHQLAAQVIPRPDSQLAANILFFVAALRGGDIRGWLGDQNLREIERIRPDLAPRLGEEFRQIGAFSREPLIGDWRIVLIPFFTGQDTEQVRLFLKPYGGEDGDETASPQGIRFVVDVNLSRLGRLQLDGLVRDDKKRLDLIVRSDEPLPATMQNDIRAIFENAAELTGINGGVSFQAAPPDFVEIAPEPGNGRGPDLVA